MSGKNKVDSKEVGLDIGLILAKYIWKTEYLHYGYWTEGLTVEAANVFQAQENYAQYLLSKIPDGVKTILDVGCGSGKFTQKLLDEGYQVDCVSPAPNLTKHVKKFTQGRADIFESRYEDVVTDKRYDLVLFSESFQYIPLANSLGNTQKFLKDDGYMLVCDFFRKNVPGRTPIGGGHDIDKYYQTITQYPFKNLLDEDITKETAPSMDVMDGFLTDVLHPIYDLMLYILDNNYPKIARFIRWKYKSKMEKLSHKYFQGKSNGESFAFFKSYHCLLYQKTK